MLPKWLLAIGLFAAAVFTHAGMLRAQWVPTNGPGGGPAVNAFAVIGSDLFAGTDNGIFISTDNGLSWSDPNPGLTTQQVTSLLADGDELFATTYGGIYLSKDRGSNWANVDSAFFVNSDAYATLLATNGTTLFAATEANGSFDPYCDVFHSTDNGVNWVRADTSFPNNGVFFAMVASGNTLFVATSQGVYGSFDEGASWKLTSAGLGNSMVMSLATLGPILFAGTNGVMTSIDSGNSWQQASNGLPKAGVTAFTVSGTTIYAGTNLSGVYRSTDSGKSWTSANVGISSLDIQALATSGANLFAGTASGGCIFRSPDGGENWASSVAGMVSSNVYSLAVSGTKLYAGLNDGAGLFVTSDGGMIWNTSGVGADNFFAIAGKDSILLSSGDGEIFRSTNDGTSWDLVFSAAMQFTSFTSINANIFVAGVGGIYRSTDEGIHWQNCSSNITNLAIYSLAAHGTDIYAGTFGNGVFHSSDYGAGWEMANNGIESTEIYALAFLGASLFAGINDGTGGIVRSTDSGRNWTYVINGLPTIFPPDVYDFAVQGTYIFAGSDNGLFISTNDGANWVNVDTGLPHQTVTSLAILGPDLYSATMGNGVWRRPLSDFGISSVAQTPATQPQIQSYPNPFSQSTTITFTSEAQGYADVRVMNLLGAEVARIFSGTLAAGEHSFVWSNPTGLPAGMYECVVRMNGQTRTIPMALTR